jgi:hypothetical protein
MANPRAKREYGRAFMLALSSTTVLTVLLMVSPFARGSLAANVLVSPGFGIAAHLVPQSMWTEWLKTWQMGCMLDGHATSPPLWFYAYTVAGVIFDSMLLTIPILFLVKALRTVTHRRLPFTAEQL